MNIFVAGASGVVGRPLVRLLRLAGHVVTATTRSPGKAKDIEAAGARAVVVEAFDAEALKRAVEVARPEVVIHQLTDLPDTIDPQSYPAATQRNARLRVDGTANLVAAAVACGARRLIAQSVAFAYAPGATPHAESDPLDVGNPARRTVVDGAVALERAVMATPGIEGVVLRYGYFYGPGTWNVSPQPPAIHIDAAAKAAQLAVTRGAAGIYNVAEDDGVVSSEKARRELGFDPAFRMS
jgi:nucleoside-diphosphate-sugar epimerase